MFTMFRQMFTAFTVLFSAAEKIAKSVDNLASVGEEMSQGYLSEFRIEQQAKLNEMQKQLKAVK